MPGSTGDCAQTTPWLCRRACEAQPVIFDDLLTRALVAGLRREDLPSQEPSFQRLVSLDGNHNFRDAGGYGVADGRTMRRGLVFRSDHLADLTDADLATIRALGLRTVHDFRLETERERQPSRLPNGAAAPEVVLLGTSDFSSLDVTVIDVIRDMLAGLRPLPASDFWETNYLDMVQTSAPMLVGFIRSIADDGRLPSLHHCTGGKDRTGLSTALLHRILGVSDDDIADDFLATNLYRTPLRVAALRDELATRGINVIDALPVLGVARRPLDVVLTYWDNGGGARAYALEHGATEAELNRLADVLLA
jgi:Tyrosine phosphatase family